MRRDQALAVTTMIAFVKPNRSAAIAATRALVSASDSSEASTRLPLAM
jgi:hypothetical protein